MRQNSLRFLLVYGFAAATALLITSCSEPRRLPIYFAEKLADNKKDTIYYQIPDFELTNQAGKRVAGQDFAGKIWVTDFFFTYCPSICPAKTNNLKAVQAAFAANPAIQFLSISLDPLRDSVPELLNYAQKHGVEAAQNWQFLKGDSVAQIERMSIKMYKLAYTRDPAAEMGINHDPRLVLTDKQRRIRGYYTGTDPEEVQRLIADIQVLLEEK
jgi:protein SCO1/2